MKISVVTPIMDEWEMLPAWFMNVLRYGDEIIIADMSKGWEVRDWVAPFIGSRVKYHRFPPPAERYVAWHEGDHRNRLLFEATGDWIVLQDADELWGEEFFDALPDLVKTKRPGIRFRHLWFWESLTTVRRPTPGRWYLRDLFAGRQVKMINRNWSYNRGLGSWGIALTWGPIPSRFRFLNRAICRTTDIPFFHYHYALGPKEGDGRRNEWKQTGINLRTYHGRHPKEARAIRGDLSPVRMVRP